MGTTNMISFQSTTRRNRPCFLLLCLVAMTSVAFLPMAHAWNSRRYFYEERYCINEDGGYMGTPPETVKNYMRCPKYCHRCDFQHPSNSIWCVQQYIGDPKDVYTESYQDDRLVVFENDTSTDASCVKRQEEFTQLLREMTGTDASCNMVHKSGVGHAYFYVCWTGAFSNRQLTTRTSSSSTTLYPKRPHVRRGQATTVSHAPQPGTATSLQFRNPSTDPWRTYNWTVAV